MELADPVQIKGCWVLPHLIVHPQVHISDSVPLPELIPLPVIWFPHFLLIEIPDSSKPGSNATSSRAKTA